MSSDNTKNLTESVEEGKTVLSQVWDAVVDGVQTVAHKAVETLQHGVEVAENVGLTVVDAALGAKDTAVEKTSEIFEASKEKAAQLSEQAAVKTAGIREVAGEYLEAGKEKAVQFTHQAAVKAEGAKETVGELFEAGKQKLSSGISKKSEESILTPSEPEFEEEEELPVRDKHILPIDEARELGKECMAKTHGKDVDPTGYIVVAPENKTAAKESEYVGGWEKVEPSTRHHVPTGTSAK